MRKLTRAIAATSMATLLTVSTAMAETGVITGRDAGVITGICDAIYSFIGVITG